MNSLTSDSLVTCPPIWLAFKLNEVVKHGIIAPLGCVGEGVIMNESSWKKTPDNLKPLIEEANSNPFRTSGGLGEDFYKVMMKEIAIC